MRRIALSVVKGPYSGLKLTFDKTEVTIGRLPTNDVSLKDDVGISSCHAALAFRDNAWTIADARSKNGTFLKNGEALERVLRPTVIKSVQLIVLGMSHLLVTSGTECDSDPLAKTELTPRRRSTPSSETHRPSASDKGTAGSMTALTLRADKVGGRIQYDFVSRKPLGTRQSINFDETDQRAMLQQIQSLVCGSYKSSKASVAAPHDDTLHRIHELGAILGRKLVPTSIMRKLCTEPFQNLLVSHTPDLLRIPWELLLVDEQFLCLRHVLGRQLLTQSSVSGLTRLGPRNTRSTHVLIVCNPTEDLPCAQAAGESLLALFHGADGTLGVDFVSGPRVQRIDLLTRLSKADIVYYNGHADFDAAHPELSGWRLADGRVTCADFRSLKRIPSLVFANGCETGREADWSSGPKRDTHAYGLASAFLFAGVAGYIGSIWPTPEDASARFGLAFFEGLLRHESVGESVRSARLALMSDKKRQSLAWMSYVYYGDPAMKFKLGRHIPKAT